MALCLATVAVFSAAPAIAQEPQKPASPNPPTQAPSRPTAGQKPPGIPASTPQHEEAELNPHAPCLQPAPSVGWEDYNGPLAKTVGLFGTKLDRPTVQSSHYKPGEVFCTLTVKGKFLLFVGDTLDPVTFLTAGFDAGIDQAQDTDPQFGQGAAGYGKRYAADFTDQASSYFFSLFLYPTIFREDPRYYRLGHGSVGRRLYHAVAHIAVAHDEKGGEMLNWSNWFGTVSSTSLSNLYHPGNRRGFDATAENVGWGFASQAGFLALREFWPEIAKKFKLPFRGQS